MIYKCTNDFFMEAYDEEEPERSFTEGKQYEVIERFSDCLLFIDDQGSEHFMEPEDMEGHLVLTH